MAPIQHTTHVQNTDPTATQQEQCSSTESNTSQNQNNVQQMSPQTIQINKSPDNGPNNLKQINKS